MNLKYEQTGLRVIVYDADCIQQPDAKLFDPGYWSKLGAVTGEAKGRTSALFLATDFGPAVLRQYRRGGWAARISPDRYLFTGFARSRPVREARMLAQLSILGLPVPRPLGGIAIRSGLYYTGALLTHRIEGAHPLADRIGALVPNDAAWFDVGRLIRRLHEAGVVHADLNARNILLGDDGAVHLLDFDRAGAVSDADRRFQSNLERLKRSLVKNWPTGRFEDFPACWESLLKGYEGAR